LDNPQHQLIAVTSNLQLELRTDSLEDWDGHGGKESLCKGLGKVKSLNSRTGLATALTPTTLGDLRYLGNLGGHRGLGKLGEGLNHPNSHRGHGSASILGNIPSHQLLGVKMVILGNLNNKVTNVTLKLILDTPKEMRKARHDDGKGKVTQGPHPT
jgi:hypothetical protein